jgi:hypothetical protein
MDSNRLDLVVPRLFAQHDPDVSLQLPYMASEVTGLAKITTKFANLQMMVTLNGGFMGTHLITTPVIEVSEDGRTAKGTWMSIGFTVMGPAFGNTTPLCHTSCSWKI